MTASTVCLRRPVSVVEEPSMNTQAVRIGLIRRGFLLKDLSAKTSIDYDRLQKVLHGYRRARPDEISAIARALDLSESEVRTSDSTTAHSVQG
jgi:hypothetical protein